MVTMSAKIVGGGGSLVDSGVAETLAKALFGDPETEMQMAKTRSALLTDEYQRRKLNAETTFQSNQNAAIWDAQHQGGQLVLDELTKQMQGPANDARTAAEAQTTQDIGSHMGPVPIEELMSVETAADYDRLAAAGDPRASLRYDEPVPIETPVPASTPVPAGPAAVPSGRPVGSDLSPQEVLSAGTSRDPAPVELPDNMNSVEEAMRIIGPGLFTSDPMGQLGKGTGLVGTVYGGGAANPDNPLLYSGKTPGEGGTDLASQESKVRGELFKLESYGKLANAAPMWQSLQDAATRNTPQSDLNMVIALAKLFDPESVVRTEEGEMIRQTAGLPTQIYGYWQMLTGDPNARLSPDTRKGMLQEGYSRMTGYYDAWNRDVAMYDQIVKAGGMRRNLVIPSLGELGEPPTSGSNGDPPADPTQWKPLPNGKNAVPGHNGQPDLSGMTADEAEQWLLLNGGR